MAKFERKGKKGKQEISTASLPDIIFMLLFFFMVTTVMRETETKVQISKPAASELDKLEKKALVDYIYVGPPKNQRYGTAPRIQLDDAFGKVDEIQGWVDKNKKRRQEAERPLITTSMKVDQNTEMGIITDIKQELREAQALKINYSTNRRERKY